MRYKQWIAIGLSLLVLSGCSSKPTVSLEDATEVALDDSDTTVEEAKDLDAKEKDGEYVIRFGAGNGEYTYKIGMDGIIKDRSFGKVEAQPEEQAQPSEAPKQDQKETETPQETTPSNVVDKQIAIDNAFANAGLAQSDVSDLSCKLNSAKTEYTVVFQFGDTKNHITLDAHSGEVISSIIE
ncbi:hypothetical protein [Dubosiella newyorkensis]|uniref:hypothetical protein n=1 Tax=Dubosiella newyorkensis TaxID=1862672 RepID=UPI0023F1096A|nr:hypothetical protein [Dubosiella newyorkensis]